MGFDPLGQKSFDSYVYEKTKGEIKKTNDTFKLDNKINEKNNQNNENNNINTENKEEIKPELLNKDNQKEIKNPVSMRFNTMKGITENIKHTIPSAGNYSRVVNQPTGEVDTIKKMRQNISY